METLKKQCSLSEHENVNAINFCPKCNIYVCNKCQNFHTELFKIHQIVNLNKDINDFFSGICDNENHSNNLDFFCKTHNILCCVGCISKIKNKIYGQHSDCEIYNLEDIEDEKKNKLKENINSLEFLSYSLDNSINDLKKIFEKINQNREYVKFKIQKIFTKIRNAVNEREDELLSEVDNQLGKLFFDEDFVKKSENLPKKIKTSLNIGREIDKLWNNDKINFFIYNCINIENNIRDINKMSQNIEKFINMKNLEVKFSPPNEYKISSILETIKSFGKIYYNNYKYSFIKVESSNKNKLDNNEIDIEGPKIGGGLDINGPKIGGPKIGGPRLDINGPKIDGPKIGVPKLDINGPKIGGPKIGGGLDINGPKIGGPKIGVPGLDINGPKIGGPKIGVPKIEGGLDINGPKIDGPKIGVPGLDINGPKIDGPKIGVPGVDINGPKIGGPKIGVPKIGGGLDINGPKIDGPKIGVPGLDINGPKIGGGLDIINGPIIVGGLDIKGPKINIYPQIPNINTPIININISNSRKYKVTGENDNILTKTGEDNNWIGAICVNELENPQENI